MTLFWLILGLITLTIGAEVLVRGASQLARAVGLPSLIIGLTVVAYGTSAPEFAVSLKAGYLNQADIALGNVVGSNTFNVLFILGLSALIAPLIASRQLIRLDVPVMIGVSLLAWALAANGSISRWEGALLLSGMVGYTAWLIILGRKQTAATAQTPPPPAAPPADPADAPWPATTDKPANLLLSGLLVLVGLALLVMGARWLVDSAVSLAQAWGVSDLLIGLTIVAAGTSLPEVATSVVASIRGQRDIAIGNVVGSNIFNLLGVLGSAALIAPDGVAVATSVLRFDLPILIAVAVACLPIFFTGGRINRWEGAVFLAYYFAYLAFLILAATGHPALQSYRSVMLYFVLPLTLLGVGVSLFNALRTRAADQATPR